MKSEELYTLIEDEIMPECMDIMRTKGEAYSGLEDTLANFKRCAKLAGVTVEQIWLVFFAKHFDAAASFVRTEYNDSEPIKGRIIDMINYLFLFAGILKEEGKLDCNESSLGGIGSSDVVHSKKNKKRS